MFEDLKHIVISGSGVGSAHVEIALVFKSICEAHALSTALFLNFLNMFRITSAFLRCQRVYLAYENQHNSDNRIALSFFKHDAL